MSIFKGNCSLTRIEEIKRLKKEAYKYGYKFYRLTSEEIKIVEGSFK